MDRDTLVQELIELQAQRERLSALWRSAHTLDMKFRAWRMIYDEVTPEIIETFEASPLRWVDPYFVDWTGSMSPIEETAWWAIRVATGIPMYPQYPALQFFIDYANPAIKVGLECDGKQFHDVDRDRERDRQLAQAGWTIYRVSGSECNRQTISDGEFSERYRADLDPYDYELAFRANQEARILNSVEGVCEAIRDHYFEADEPADPFKQSLYERTLEAHRLV